MPNKISKELTSGVSTAGQRKVEFVVTELSSSMNNVVNAANKKVASLKMQLANYTDFASWKNKDGEIKAGIVDNWAENVHAVLTQLSQAENELQIALAMQKEFFTEE